MPEQPPADGTPAPHVPPAAIVRPAMSQLPNAYKPRRSDASAGWAVLGTLVAGIAVWGGAGALLDHLLGTTFLVLIGLLLGFVAAMYLVYIRYARQ